jgi:hypothetical protein
MKWPRIRPSAPLLEGGRHTLADWVERAEIVLPRTLLASY